MRVTPYSPTAPAAPDHVRSLRVVSIVLVSAYAAALCWAVYAGGFLYDAEGLPHASDFVSGFAAGRLALEGQAAAAYDWSLHKQAEVAATGFDFDGYFSWSYPPTFLLLTAPLALMAYAPAHLVWLAATLPLYSAAIRAILPRPGVALAALAFPAAFWNAGCGQNGFLSAALIAGGLAALERRPALAGVLFGLMTYKPHLGLMIPLALIAGGHWRAFAAAALTALGMAVVSLLAFGPEAWTAFAQSAGLMNRGVMVEGRANFGELLSPFGMVRWLGGAPPLAWSVQLAAATGLGVFVWRTWRRPAPFAPKAAFLAAATLVASPYLYVYDLTILAAPIAFLARDGLSEQERNWIAAACLGVLAGPVLDLPVAALAAPIVLALTAVRLSGAKSSATA